MRMDHLKAQRPGPEAHSLLSHNPALRREIELGSSAPDVGATVPQAAFMLTVEVAIFVSSSSALISSCNVWSRSFAASLKPSS